MPGPLPIVALAGRHVRLEPLTFDHVEALVAAAGQDRSTYGFTNVPDGAAAMTAYVEQLMSDHRRGAALPFVQRRVDTDRVVGCTRFMDPRWWRGRPLPDEIEIGGTWLAAEAQRTAVNTEAKLLLLGHAFECFGVWRVAICTDARNHRSREAIERIGAVFEGVLRNHRPVTGSAAVTPRDSAMYSITDREWPTVRAGLQERLGRSPGGWGELRPDPAPPGVS